MATSLPHLPNVERISTNVVRILGGNPSKYTLQGSNTYLLGNGRERILLDTAQGFPAWKSNLMAAVSLSASSSDFSSSSTTESAEEDHERQVEEKGEGEKTQIKTCLLSHWHLDHVLGVNDLVSVFPHVKIHKCMGKEYDPDKSLQDERIVVHGIRDGDRFTCSGTTTAATGGTETSLSSASGNPGEGARGRGDEEFEIQAVHCPGHAKDHMAFIITASPDPDEVGSMFTADNVLGHGTAVFEDLATYISSLHLMKERTRDILSRQTIQNTTTTTGSSTGSGEGGRQGAARPRAFPGHGAVIEDSQAKLDEYIRHRQMREEEALNVLRHGVTVKPDNVPPFNVGGSPQSQTATTTDGVDGGGKDGDRNGSTDKEWESMEMVKIIYRQYPESLHQPAELGLLQVLRKLEGEGKVIKTDRGKWRWSGSRNREGEGEGGGDSNGRTKM